MTADGGTTTSFPDITHGQDNDCLLCLFSAHNTTISKTSDAILYARHLLYITTAALCCFGLVFNVINLRVFRRQGFAECVHISLTGLAVSDLMVLFFILLYRPASWSLEIQSGEEPTELLHAGGWLVIGLAINSSWLAVFICVERCLCIALPFKVKDIITPKVTTSVVVAIFLVSVGTVVPSLCALRLEYRMDEYRNESTTLALVFTENRLLFTKVSYFLATPLQISSIISLCVVTLALIIFLTRHQKSRQTFLSSTKTNGATCNRINKMSEYDHKTRKTCSKNAHNISGTTNKERRLVRMVVSLSCVILACYIPAQLLSVVTLLEPEFTGQGRYQKLYRLCWGVAYFLYALNSSINLFVYYNMSSKFRSTLKAMLEMNRDLI